MKMKEQKRKADAVLVLVLFGVFAVCILAVLLTSADAYRRLAERDEQSYDHRVATQYLATRVRQGDEAGRILVETFDGVDALVLREEIEGEVYETRVYCYDGYLRELFAAQGEPFAAEDGEQVLRAEALTLSLENQVITAEITDSDGQVRAMTLYLRSGEGRGR
jgi:hypothetical protein